MPQALYDRHAQRTPYCSVLRSSTTVPSQRKLYVNSQHIVDLGSSVTMSGTEISPGSVISLTDGRQGTVRFIGTTHFAVGDWIGVELTEATGKNDGAVQGERYFDCEAGYGMFIRPTAVGAVLQAPPRESKQTTRAGSNASSRNPSIAAGAKKQPGMPPSAVRRQSTNASTPTPASRMASRSSLRVCPSSR